MAKTVKANTEQKKEFKLEQAFALWKRKSQNGKSYFTGKGIIGFYNGKKKNPKEPDLRIFTQTKSDVGSVIGDEVCSLWLNESALKNKQYFTGKYNDKKVVGFINKSENEKAPYISVYYSEDKKETDVGENYTVLDEPETDSDLPF